MSIIFVFVNILYNLSRKFSLLSCFLMFTSGYLVPDDNEVWGFEIAKCDKVAFNLARRLHLNCAVEIIPLPIILHLLIFRNITFLTFTFLTV